MEQSASLVKVNALDLNVLRVEKMNTAETLTFVMDIDVI
jgi:hypothetical protein